MATDGSKMGDGKTSPFGNGNGGTSAMGNASGGHDFLTDPKSGAPATGGHDFTQDSRPQSEAKPEVVPNPQEIPAGGKQMKLDPGPVSKVVSGTAVGPTERAPFKGMR